MRAAACTAVSSFGDVIAAKALPVLMKIFKEGQQNKQVVAETIISLGPKGEQQLIALVKQSPSESKTNPKAKECILKAFAVANVQNPNIDFVIETLFYAYAREPEAAVRCAALISLDILHKRSQQL